MATEPRLICRVKALYPFASNDGSSLKFEPGDTIHVLAQLPSGWWDGLCNGTRGWFPSNYVEIIDDLDNNSVITRNSLQNDTNNTAMSIYSDLTSQDTNLRPSSQLSRGTQLFDDQIEQSTTRTSLPTNWTIEKTEDGKSTYYYNQKTGEIQPIDSNDPILLDTYDEEDDDNNMGMDMNMNGIDDDDDDDDDDDTTSDLDPNHDSLSYVGSKNDSVDDANRIKSNDTTGILFQSGNEFNGDWIDSDQITSQLPPPWVKRTLPQGGICYYNMATHETAWDINDIMEFTRELLPQGGSMLQKQQNVDTPKPQPRSPARKQSTKRGTVINVNEPLTWKKLSVHIALAIHNINIATRNPTDQHYKSYTASIVDAIRLMLLASGTLDKDSMHLRTNAILRAHHRTMMAALSKLILSSESYNQNTTEYVNKILSDSNELLLATRNFISTAESIPIQVQHMEPTLQDRTLDNPNITAFRKASRNKFSLDEDLAENIEVYGTNMKDAVDGIVKSINTFQQQPSTTNLELTRSNFSATLFSQFRNFSSQTGQFLDIFEDIDYRKLQSPELIELNMTRQKLYDSLGEVFCKMQILTMDNTSLLEGITKDLNQDGIEIKKIIDSICHCVDKLAFDPNIKQQNMDKKSMARRSSDAMFASSGGNVSSNGTAGSGSKRVRASLASTNLTSSSIIEENDEEDMDNESYYTDVRSSSSHGGESAPFSTFDDFPSPTEPTIREEEGLNNNDNNNEDKTTNNDNNSQHRKTSTSSDFPRQSTAKLKKFFGDDVPESIPATTSTVDQTTTVIGGPPSVGVSSTAGNVTDNERPWYLQYDYKPNEIVFNMEGSVKGGTLDALVVRLTLHDYLDMNFINTFLLTYRSFCSSMQLLKLLEERYNTKPPEGLNEQELDIWMNKKLKLIRLRVFNVLKNWFEQYYNEDDTVILDELDRFTKATIHSTLPFSAEQLERLIKKRRESNCDGLKKMVLTQPTILPQPIIPRNRKKFKLLDVDTMELARQLTIMDFKLYSSIRPVECLNKAWSKDAEDDHAQVAVNIRASIEYCNQVTSWVSDAILSQLEVKKRVALIKYWVQVAERCRHLNNFNTCMAILSAFDNSAVGRLKRTWEMVGARTNHVLSQIRKLMGANKNFTEYRAIIHSINPPCIPFLGIYLQDLTFIEDGNADYLKTSKDMINFAKRAKTAEVIREIQQYQSTYYHLTVVDEIQAFIQNNLQSIRDEEQLYNESLKLEPREREDEKITRLLQESGFL